MTGTRFGEKFRLAAVMPPEWLRFRTIRLPPEWLSDNLSDAVISGGCKFVFVAFRLRFSSGVSEF